jgi:hypothetical protein
MFLSFSKKKNLHFIIVVMNLDMVQTYWNVAKELLDSLFYVIIVPKGNYNFDIDLFKT